MQDSAQWTRLYTSSDCAAGIRAFGMAQMLKTKFGRMAHAVFVETSSETSNGIIGGYKTGAGSNVTGNDIGIQEEGSAMLVGPDYQSQGVDQKQTGKYPELCDVLYSSIRASSK